MEESSKCLNHPQSGDKKTFSLVSASVMTEKPVQIEWLVENFIEKGSLNLLFGEPGVGKSLFALDWAYCLAAGINWHKYRTMKTDVVIIAGEGFAGMQRRLKALEYKYNCKKAPENLFISQRPAQLLDENDVQLIANSIQKICPNPGLIIIDTLHRNMDGDENSSRDIGKLINHIDLFLKPLRAGVLIVHHSGHDNKGRGRGSSSIKAAMDGEFSVTKKNDSVTFACTKAKDFEIFKPLQFSLKVTELEWMDNDGKPMTSVYLDYIGEASYPSKQCKLSSTDEEVKKSLNDVITAKGIAPTNEIGEQFKLPIGKMKKIVLIDLWREEAYKIIKVKSDNKEAKRMAFNRSREKLIKQGYIVESNNYVWFKIE